LDPGWGKLESYSPSKLLGRLAHVLQFASDFATNRKKVFVSFFVDIPDCTARMEPDNP